MKKNSLFETLKERGYVYQTTNEDKVKELLDGKPICAYVGVDPTADSLHIGHCLPLIMAKYLQDAGHKIIIVLGGATAMIGDPSGKNDMRKMVSSDFVEKNKEGIKEAISHFLKLDGDNPAIIVNNLDWFKNYDYINFMRDIGVHFNVAQMLSCDAYKNRIASGGLTFFEMGYMLMQAYDFLYLNRNYGCRLQFGGSDQWANILAGANLGRKISIIENKDPETFQAFTNVLLLNADGKKMGKTEKGALWVNKEKCSSYDFYQYFYNCDDRDVEKFFKILTYLPLDQIADIMKQDIRDAKKRLAYEITKVVHNEEEAKLAMETAEKVFGGEVSVDDLPIKEVFIESDVINIVDLVSALGESKSQSRRLIESGAILVNNEKICDIKKDFDIKQTSQFVVRKGKKSFTNVCVTKK